VFVTLTNLLSSLNTDNRPKAAQNNILFLQLPASKKKSPSDLIVLRNEVRLSHALRGYKADKKVLRECGVAKKEVWEVVLIHHVVLKLMYSLYDSKTLCLSTAD
jgi:hypothetical protein